MPCPSEMVPGTWRMISPTTAMMGAWTSSMRVRCLRIWDIGIQGVTLCNTEQGLMASIRVFVTGGTFDKEYNELTGSLAFNATHLPEMLRLGRCRLDVEVSTLMMIDSLDMTGADRALIVDRCRQAAESRILVTHGTDTMVDTARALAAAFPDA